MKKAREYMTAEEVRLSKEYRTWFKSLSPKEKKAAKEAGVDKPKFDRDTRRISATGGEEEHLSADPVTTQLIARDWHELSHLLGATPLDEVANEEEKLLESGEAYTANEVARIKADAISAMLAHFFTPINKKAPSPLDVTSSVYLLAYLVRPSLIKGWSLEKIAKCFDYTKQAFSKRLIKMNGELNVRSRNQKSATSVSIYREGTTQWHAEKAAAEKAAKRKEYLAAWKKANDAEQKAYQAQYRATNRERLNAAKRTKRATV